MNNTARNEAIIEMAAMGYSEPEIAGLLGLTHGVVHGVLCRWRARPRRLAQKAPAKSSIAIGGSMARPAYQVAATL